MKEIYLDNSATTKPLPEVINYMQKALKSTYGNPSSLHNKGLAAEKIIKEARELIAKRLHVSPKEIFFTSGGTESNNLAIQGIINSYLHRGKHVITSEIEHPSVLNVFKQLEKEGLEVTFLKVDKKGQINLDNLKQAIKEDTILISIMHVNNELGSIQDINHIGKIIKEKNNKTFFHVDCVQSFGKIALTSKNIDLLSISAHKFHGPKGIASLYKKQGIKLKPLFYGGGQEDNLRSGTENLPGIAGFIPAIKKLPIFNGQQNRDEKLVKLKNYFIKKLKDKLTQVIINSPTEGAPHIINLSFPKLKGEIIVHSLEAKGIYISTGSACHSKQKEKNHVLQAINLDPDLLAGAIRISLSPYNTKEELDYTIQSLSEQIKLYF